MTYKKIARAGAYRRMWGWMKPAARTDYRMFVIQLRRDFVTSCRPKVSRFYNPHGRYCL
jgi:hypothetical protein